MPSLLKCLARVSTGLTAACKRSLASGPYLAAAAGWNCGRSEALTNALFSLDVWNRERRIEGVALWALSTLLPGVTAAQPPPPPPPATTIQTTEATYKSYRHSLWATRPFRSSFGLKTSAPLLVFKRHHSTHNLYSTQKAPQVASNDDRKKAPASPTRTLKPIRKKKNPIGVTELPERFRMVWPKITLFGDSLTRRAFDVENGCWGSMLANKVGDYFDVDARGFAGYNSRWALEMMSKLFPKSYLSQVEIFILLFGHNDSWEPSNPLHVPVDEYERNMNAIVQYLLDNGVARRKIILITPNWYHLPSFTEYHISQGLPTTQKEFRDTVKYGEAVIRIARKEQIDHLDAFTLSYKHDPLEELFCDGVHYSFKGAKLLFEHLWPIVDRKISDSFNKPTNQLFHATPWDEIPSVKVTLDAHRKKLEAEARARRGY